MKTLGYMNSHLKKKPKSKTKPKQYPLDEYIDKVWYDDWLKKQKDKPKPKHYWKVGGTD
jgi:hypothetical protein|tara:strand:+ start:142 stop:318 length:177 start_codon:yes stop_codon:yes gene_type:complete